MNLTTHTFFRELDAAETHEVTFRRFVEEVGKISRKQLME